MDQRQAPLARLSVPSLSARLSPQTVASTVTRLIASGGADTHADLVRVTGLARTTVSSVVESLLAAGVIMSVGSRPKVGRGRPAEHFALEPSFGLILVADVGAHVAHLSLHDLGQNLMAERRMPLSIRDGPEAILRLIVAHFRSILAESPFGAKLLGVVIGLPGPIDPLRGMPVKPPNMPGWDAYPVAQELAAEFDAPVQVENNVNLHALGEARSLPVDQSPLLYIRVSTGIDGGLVTAAGDLHHGADGAAGDIGHVRVPGVGDILCACGNYGCIEAVASASAILRHLRQRHTGTGEPPASLEELLHALRSHDSVTVQLVREAAERVGEVVASLVHFFNPARVVVGGSLTVASDDMLAGVRAVVYRRALPLATRNLVINHPVLGERSGIAGGLVLGIERALTEDALSAAMHANGHDV